MLYETENKLMSDITARKKLSLKSLAEQMRQIQERVEDMEDLMELRAAVERNGDKPGVPWEQVKTELQL